MSRIARHGLLALALLVVGCSERSERSPPAAADSLAAVEGAGTEEAPSPDTGGPTVAREPAQAAVDTTGSTGVESATTGTALPEPDTTTAQVPPADPAAAQTRTGIQSEDLRAVLARLDQIALAQAALAARLDSLREARATGEESGTAPSQVLGQARDEVRGFGVGVVWATIVLVLFNFLIHAFVWVLDALAERSVGRRLFFKKLVPVTRILLWLFAAYLIVRVIFQVDAQGLLAAAAAVGVAVGFAAQDLLKNLFGGLILVFDQPFQVGDKISVGGTYGEVVGIGLRSTRIVTPDDSLVTVPNAEAVGGQVANANAGQLNCQVVTDLYLPGWVDEARAKRIAFEAAASSKYVYLNKPIVVLVLDEFKETFLTHLKVKAYVLDPRYEFVFQSDVTERARAGFRDAGLLQWGHGLRAYLDLSRVSGVTGGPDGSDGSDSGD